MFIKECNKRHYFQNRFLKKTKFLGNKISIIGHKCTIYFAYKDAGTAAPPPYHFRVLCMTVKKSQAVSPAVYNLYALFQKGNTSFGPQDIWAICIPLLIKMSLLYIMIRLLS
jgi:hypothetical protein